MRVQFVTYVTVSVTVFVQIVATIAVHGYVCARVTALTNLHPPPHTHTKRYLSVLKSVFLDNLLLQVKGTCFWQHSHHLYGYTLNA